jgi:flagellar basal-body rod protein FlgB
LFQNGREKSGLSPAGLRQSLAPFSRIGRQKTAASSFACPVALRARAFGTLPAEPLPSAGLSPHHRRFFVVNERLFGIHGAALTLRSERMGVIASNIANAATPGYKARDIDFNAALDARLARARVVSTANPEAGMVWRRPTMPSLDGNTVELNREQVAFAENAVAYSATLSFVQGKVNTITRALKGE